MKVINLSKILKYKLQVIIIIAIIIAFVLIYVSGNILFNKNNELNEFESNYINFNYNSYYCKSNVKVYSNKNNNEYIVIEKYKKINNELCYIFEFKNDKSISKYIINSDKIKIENNMQKNKYFIENNIEKLNLMSINTYLILLDEYIKLNNINNENITNINIELDKIKNDKFMELNNINLIFNEKGLSKIYVYDKNDKIYLEFEIIEIIKNYKIENKEFDF